MVSYRTSRVIQTVIVGLLILLIVFAVVFGVRSALSNKPAVTTEIAKPALLNTNADRSVRLTVRGPIVADDNFMSYTIDISPNFRILTISKGYLNIVTRKVNINNNIPAYEQFVYALDNAGFMKGDETTNNETRGVCAAGKLYEYETLQNSETVKKLWTSTCRKGNTKSSHKIISSLFIQQIPAADGIIDDIW